MTPHEIELALALGSVGHFPGTLKKRFCKDMAWTAENDSGRELTERQRYYLECLAWHYRRQLPRHLIPHKQPLPLPPKRKEPSKRKSKTAAAAAVPQDDLFQ